MYPCGGIREYCNGGVVGGRVDSEVAGEGEFDLGCWTVGTKDANFDTRSGMFDLGTVVIGGRRGERCS